MHDPQALARHMGPQTRRENNLPPLPPGRTPRMFTFHDVRTIVMFAGLEGAPLTSQVIEDLDAAGKLETSPGSRETQP